ncbi:MAG: GxxExxY protein [Prevotella sp.]|nr:GxxExxY protein [Prevotella sp.]MBQ6658483.1 GxxExxY protein [Prevotella sp.]MBQ9571078.1 GxxExxY protein [Prevotella sp.]
MEQKNHLTSSELEQYNNITRKIIGAAIEVHKELGAGLLESAYEYCLRSELVNQGLKVDTQIDLPLYYKGVPTGKFYRIDMMVEDKIIVELKAIDAILPIHEVQLVTYLRLTQKVVGLIINFNVAVLKDGIKRKINAVIDYDGIKSIRE